MTSLPRLRRADTDMTTDSAELSDGRPDEDDQKAEDELDAAYEVDDLADAKPKKKRKIIKNSDKKYQCPHGDCGKSYSRAEHLYRHQLNRMFHATSHATIL